MGNFNTACPNAEEVTVAGICQQDEVSKAWLPVTDYQNVALPLSSFLQPRHHLLFGGSMSRDDFTLLSAYDRRGLGSS